jgi:hypothetical protein
MRRVTAAEKSAVLSCVDLVEQDGLLVESSIDISAPCGYERDGDAQSCREPNDTVDKGKVIRVRSRQIW